MPSEYETQLAQMLGPLRTTNQPKFDDPSKIVPSTFPVAQKATVQRTRMESPDTGGDYNPQTNTIRINDLPGLMKNLRKQMEKVQPSSKKKVSGPEIYEPAVVPHEAGHAIFNELLQRVLDTNHPDTTGAVKAVSDWGTLHQKFLKENKALGQYQYRDDPRHSFADAFGAWVVNPAKLKNLFPEMYDYFAALGTPREAAAK